MDLYEKWSVAWMSPKIQILVFGHDWGNFIPLLPSTEL